MRSLDEAMGQELHWVKPRWTKRAFELRAGETVVARLTWIHRFQALGQWAGEQYRFCPRGWLWPRTLVYRDDGGAATEYSDEHAEPVATFRRRGSTLTLSDGRTFVWKKPKRWTKERIWVDQDANELVRFRTSAWTSTSGVTIQPGSAPEAEAALLLLLGQYLLVLAADESAAASSAAIVAAISS